ncbi:MAG: DUF4167 domain-containing protein [Pseudomonadota bacterium]
MRSSKSRSRSKNNRNRSAGNNINRVFDSSGPEGKVRGTPQQIIDKYLQLHRDAQLSNDPVAAENFQQHAEHYTRLLSEAQRELEARREQQERENAQRQRERDEARAQRQERETEAGTLVETPEAAVGEGEQPDVAPAAADAPEVVDTPETAPKPRKPRARRKPKEASAGADDQQSEAQEAAE